MTKDIENKSTVQYILKKYREKKGYSQEDVAKSLNVTAQTISNYELGIRVPDIYTLIPLSELLGFELNELKRGFKGEEFYSLTTKNNDEGVREVQKYVGMIAKYLHGEDKILGYVILSELVKKDITFDSEETLLRALNQYVWVSPKEKKPIIMTKQAQIQAQNYILIEKVRQQLSEKYSMQ